jgi:hypothetical protein
MRRKSIWILHTGTYKTDGSSCPIFRLFPLLLLHYISDFKQWEKEINLDPACNKRQQLTDLLFLPFINCFSIIHIRF